MPQVSELVNTQAWEWDLRNNSARLEDQRLLHEQLDDFHRNKSKLAEALSLCSLSYKPWYSFDAMFAAQTFNRPMYQQ
jgi:hypothetical protein